MSALTEFLDTQTNQSNLYLKSSDLFSTSMLANIPMLSPIDETVVPHYFGPYSNYANSPMPKGIVESITVNSPGSGYSDSTVVLIVDVYGTGSDATATPVLGADGKIETIVVVNTGQDYTAPMVIISDVSGSGAVATPNLGGLSGGIHKFVDSIPGLDPAGANNLGQYIPVGIPDTTTFVGTYDGVDYSADYYEIAVVEYTEKLHTDLPATRLRGYVQLSTAVTRLNAGDEQVPLVDANGNPILMPDGDQAIGVHKPHSLGPVIVAMRDKPVRIKFLNLLPTGEDGNLFIPVDTTVMGAGMGPLTDAGAPCDPDALDATCATYKQNRATLHLHGGFVPWISDGTPHQWITPAAETTAYPKGVSVRNVPDMWFDKFGNVIVGIAPGVTDISAIPAPGGGNYQSADPLLPNYATNDSGKGSQTFYYTNQQSARLQFYHDHSYGITRLNVYAGEAAGYLITDSVEQDMINGTNNSGVNPDLLAPFGTPTLAARGSGVGFPLIIQDKTIVDETTIKAQDPTWRWGSGIKILGRPQPKTGDLWLPHVYMPIQNPWDILGGASAFGRWQYGPWFWPPTENIINKPIANEYYDPLCNSVYTWCEPPQRPQSPDPSMTMESYMDTAQVNGTFYPYMDVEPKPYRFRVLNAANDRFINLQFYVAADKNSPTIPGIEGTVMCDGSAAVAVEPANCTEVKMVNALATNGFPETWPTDGRAGGVPDPATAGPAIIQLGTEGGFLPAPVVIQNQPINWNLNPGNFNVGNVNDGTLILGNAERADIIVDFTQYAGQTLILYNDAPTAFPALDPRYDYYTGDPSQMDSGGAPTTQPGFGPNTRTLMQFRVSGTASGHIVNNAYDPTLFSNLETIYATGKTPAEPGGKPSIFEASQDTIIFPQNSYASSYGVHGPDFPDDSNQYAKITDRSLTFTPIGQTEPVKINFTEKAIHDEMGASYDQEYGRMSGNLGIEIPGTNNLNQNIILYGYASPPVDILKDSKSELIGSLNDGTQLWKITHNGVDTHPIHIHLANAQIINRVAWDGMLLPIDPNEYGWKETIRVNPLESTILAIRPYMPKLPFEIENSIRLIDPIKPEGATLMGPPGGFIDPKLNARTVTNHLVNYGWEYVWHCHILSHEEMDMMHSLPFAATPKAPTNLAVVTDSTSGTNKSVLTWDDNSIAETRYRIQRATDPDFTTNLLEILVAESATTYTDDALPDPTAPDAYYYRVYAENVVGDTATGMANFPKQIAISDPTAAVHGTASSATIKFSGNAAAISGATITYTGTSTGTSLTSAAGAYLLTIPSPWTGDISASKTGYTFSPSKFSLSAESVTQEAKDFTIFEKTAPVNNATATSITSSITWSAHADAVSYQYCIDINGSNTTCDSPSTWIDVGTALTASPADLVNSTTYYWQVRAVLASGSVEADGGNWASFSTIPGSFTKTGPTNVGSPIAGTSATLQWSASANAQAYRYCMDLTNNTTCESQWIYAADPATGLPVTSLTINGLSRGKTYYWQVRAEHASGVTYADDSSTVFWSFTMANPGGIVISEHAPSTAEYGSTFHVTATSLNGPVLISSLTTSVCSYNNLTGIFTMLTHTGLCTVKYEVTGTNAGIVTEIVSAAKANVTITATAQNKFFGDTDPALTYTGSLKFSDTLTLKRAVGENIGNYAITVDTFAANNKYVLTYVGANLTINKLPITVTPDSVAKIYGASDPAFTYTFSPALIGIDHFAGALTHSGNELVGSKPIVIGTLTAGNNYSITLSPATLTINKRTIIVQADAKTKVYGESDPQYTYSVVSGFLAYSDSMTLLCNSGTGIGSYPIVLANFPAQNNYTLTFRSSNLTIQKRPISVQADEKMKLVNTADPAFTYKITSGNLVGSDAFAGTLIRNPGELVGIYSIGRGDLSLNGNYLMTYTPANFIIAPYLKVRITGNVGIGGVSVAFTGGTTVTSAANGAYSFTVPYHWSGTVTPTKVGYVFAPASRSYVELVADRASENYKAQVTISGNTGTANTVLSYFDVTNKQATSNGSGNYSILVPYGWVGTITPSKAGVPSFSPASHSYNGVSVNKANENFIPNVALSVVSTASLDGYIKETTETSGQGGVVTSAGTLLLIGDDVLNRQFRALLSFNTSTLPDNAVIVSATLKLKQKSIVGVNTLAVLGTLTADVRQPFFGTTSGLLAEDFSALPGMGTAATFDIANMGAYFKTIFKTAALTQINKAGTTQVRLRFSIDDNNNLAANYVTLASGETALLAEKPTLIIEYYIP